MNEQKQIVAGEEPPKMALLMEVDDKPGALHEVNKWKRGL